MQNTIMPMRGLKPLLLYKIIEQAETEQGWLDDGAANRLAIAQAHTPDQWLLLRAKILSEQSQFAQTLLAVQSTVAWGNLIAWALCAVLGFMAGLSVLGLAQTPVNVLWVVLSLLGLPTVTLFLWLLAILNTRSSGGALGSMVQSLIRRFVKAPNISLFWQAWHQTTTPKGSQRWLFSMLTHGFWLIALTFSLISMAIAFSVKHYVFMWQTTWLDSQTFVTVASFLGSLPAQLHFNMPQPSLIEQSGNTALDVWEARTLWARWLIAVIFVWGVLPRLVLFLLSYLRWHQSTAYLLPSTTDAYALACLARLERVKSRLTPEGKTSLPDAQIWQAPQIKTLGESTADLALLGIELRHFPAWANNKEDKPWQSLGIVDDLSSREHALQTLSLRPPLKLLIICDAQQTPDRGTLRLIDNLRQLAQHTHVYLLQSTPHSQTLVWQKSLYDLGIQTIYTVEQDATQWLTTSH